VSASGFSLEGNVALVTGGRRGLGKAIALAFAEAGADVAVCDLVADSGELEEVAKAVRSFGRRAMCLEIDTSKKKSVDEVVQAVIAGFGCIDILVNNAAIVLRIPLIDLSEEDWQKMIDVDLKGYFLCSQVVGRKMIERKKGTMINIASSMGMKAGQNRGAYSVAKAGVIMLTRVLALELAKYNIRVNAISPHIIKTDFSRPVWSDPEALKSVLADVPLGRSGEPDDVARPAVFLASDASKYMTGHTIAVDGGWLA
jgi:NAD(P)-dependent dehydrogenase (short-subunit alcohol dehydrogenase family)